MKPIVRALLVTGSLLTALQVAGQGRVTLTFDDLVAWPNPGWQQVGEQYARYGVHFSPTDTAVLGGLSNGDLGSWGLEGTVGPHFDGFNGYAPGSPFQNFTMTLIFDTPITWFSLDVSRANGSTPTTSFLMSGFYGASAAGQVEGGLGPINQWSTFTLTGPIDRITFGASGIYGVDNLQFIAIPEPSSWSLLLVATLLLSKPRVARAPERIGCAVATTLPNACLTKPVQPTPR